MLLISQSEISEGQSESGEVLLLSRVRASALFLDLRKVLPLAFTCSLAGVAEVLWLDVGVDVSSKTSCSSSSFTHFMRNIGGKGVGARATSS